MIIALSATGPDLVDQIRDQIRGLVATGQLSAGARLPSVRQLAGDLGIAPGTVAKAYRALEAEGILTTRVGSGTRVAQTAPATPDQVLDAARRLAAVARSADVDVDEAVVILRSIWPN